jgi:Ca2+/Na+ antiporter
VIANESERLDVLFPVGASLVVSTLALVLFPGIATIACQFLIGLTLIGIFLSRKLFRYAKERRHRAIEQPTAAKRSLDRSDVLLLLGFAALYAASSGILVSAGCSINAVRSCGFLLLMIAVLVKPHVAAWRTGKIAHGDRNRTRGAND